MTHRIVFALLLILAACEGRIGPTRPPDAVRLHLIHAAPQAPPLDVYLTGAGADLATAAKLVEPFVYGVDTTESSGLVGRDPAELQVRFTHDGTLSVVLDTGPFSGAGGQLITVTLSHDARGQLVVRVTPEP